EGRVPGLFITQTGGLPGGAVNVHIQGLNSISRGNDPLYVIDGIPYAAQLPSNLGGPLIASNSSSTNIPQNTTGSPFSFLNPDDIETIEVLKDAAATAIYGSRAANGAILITTKKGQSGKTKVDVTLQNGIGTVAHMMNLLNTQQYLQMRKEAYKNDGLALTDLSPSDVYDLTNYDQNR